MEDSVRRTKIGIKIGPPDHFWQQDSFQKRSALQILVPGSDLAVKMVPGTILADKIAPP